VAIASGAYAEGSSAIQRLDPRTKLIGTLLFVLTVALIRSGSWFAFAGMYAIWLVLVRAARVPLALLLRRSLWAVPFLLAALVVPFTTPGEPLFRMPLTGWQATEVGLSQAATLVLRTWISVQGFLLLAATTDPQDLLWSLQTMRFPPLLVMIIAFAQRYLGVLAGEASRMLRARRARSAGRPRRAGMRLQVRSMGSLIGSLFLRALERSERVYAAMLSRGYDGQIRELTVHRWGRTDLLSLLSLTAVFAVVAAVSYR